MRRASLAFAAFAGSWLLFIGATAAVCSLAGCDAAEPVDASSHRDGAAPQRVNPDPCANAPQHPGITLTEDEVAIADLCIAELDGVDACLIALGDAPGTVEIWCEFACGETVSTLAAYPNAGAVRVELQSPCG